MEKSRSLIRQVIGHKMFFVVFLLFPTDVLVEDVALTNVNFNNHSTASLNLSTSPFPATSKIFTTSVISPPDATTMPDTLSRNLSIPGQPALAFNATPPASKQEVQSATAVNAAVPEDTSSPMRSHVTVSTEEKHPRTEATEVQESKPPPATAVNAAVPEDTSSPMRSHVAVSTEEKHPRTEATEVQESKPPPATAVNAAVPEDTSSPMRSHVITVSTEEKHPRTEATEVQESKPPPVQKEIPSKITVTPYFDSKTVSSPTKDLGTRSQGSFSEQSSTAIAYLEKTMSTEPKVDRKGPMPPSPAVPELTQTPETGSHYMSGPFTTSATSFNGASISDSSDESPSGKKHSLIILAVVFSILLLVGLLVFLYFRRRRHSGSTSFNSPEWAGQATLPDDTGLDKDVEQQVGSAGERETRRGTLVTFFGKRQSRVPSIAMEDVNGKGGNEETEQLLCGEAEIGSPSEAIGDANGKVPEPLKESSQESPASNKSGKSPS